jgi:hypothetical protein
MDAMLTSLADDGSPLAVMAKLIWVAQLALIVHALKTGRPYWWFWILISAPIIGGIAYALIEVAPEFHGSGGRMSWKPRAWRVRDLREELEETDTVKLRLALASELLASGEADAACATAEQSLTGVWRDDPHTLAAVARYRLEAGKVKEALDALGKINTRADRLLAQQVAVMRGRALVQAGRHAEAQAVLQSAMNVFMGEEARYHLAVSLQASGSTEAARDLWLEIRKRFRRASRGWRRSEKRWFKLAGERLAETKS